MLAQLTGNQSALEATIAEPCTRLLRSPVDQLRALRIVVRRDIEWTQRRNDIDLHTRRIELKVAHELACDDERQRMQGLRDRATRRRMQRTREAGR